jgi:hypothetical protein
VNYIWCILRENCKREAVALYLKESATSWYSVPLHFTPLNNPGNLDQAAKDYKRGYNLMMNVMTTINKHYNPSSPKNEE